ncbi:nuclear transport factor 2 family protein [Streptomyces triticirhizae]|uniref:nuclear transport factor 2 family protein n=1 Tax=Streptomyces triticirhizae TaxID=2483353 RepID=UPI001F472E74|nr:nuclear transport factor 2 family protein [Streptomyces triticirhizae]
MLAERACGRLLADPVVHTPETASVTSCLATFRVDGHRGEPLPAGPPVRVGHHEDRFQRRDGRWPLAHRTPHLAFGVATPRA